VNIRARSADASTTEEIVDRATGVLSASLRTSFPKQLFYDGASAFHTLSQRLHASPGRGMRHQCDPAIGFERHEQLGSLPKAESPADRRGY